MTDRSTSLGWVVALMTLAILWTIFLIPLNSDSDIYQAMAVDLWRYGKLPYMQSWDHNFPGIVYLHWIPLVLFGNSDAAFRVLDLATNLTSAYFIYKLTARYADQELALLAPVVYAIYYVSGGWWAIGQRDVFACTFLLAASLIYVKRGPSITVSSNLLLGALIGCAAFIRPTYTLLLPLLLLRHFRFRSALYGSLGFTMPFLLFAISYTLAGGDLSEVILATITYNTQAYGGLAESWSDLVARSPFQIIFVLFGTVGIFRLIKRSGDDNIWGLFAGLLTGLASVIVMRKFFIYHFHVLFTYLLIVAFVGFDTALSPIRGKVRIAIAGAAVALLLFCLYPRHLLAIALRGSGGIASRVRHTQAAFSLDSSFGRAVDLRLSEYLGSEKNVELVSVTPAVQWMNELDRPSRFTMIHCLTTVGVSGRLTTFQERWRQEYLSALEKRKPKIIALADGPSFLMKYIRRSPKDLALEIQGTDGQQGFAQLLEQHYVLDTTIGGYYIYKRNIP